MKYIVTNKKDHAIHVPGIGNLEPGKQELDLDDRQVEYLRGVPKTVVSLKAEQEKKPKKGKGVKT